MDASSYLQGRPDPVQVIDVRRPDEWDAGHLESARNIPLDELADRLGELDKGTPILAVCRTGVRSAKAADLLVAQGFDAESIEGGVVGLAEAGVELVDAAGSPVASPDNDDSGDPELDRMQDSMIEVIVAMQQHFGDRERTEAEELEFLREYLAGKGRTPEEIEAFMAPE
jgi:rhodanese-related sulfurtransferase